MSLIAPVSDALTEKGRRILIEAYESAFVLGEVYPLVTFLTFYLESLKEIVSLKRNPLQRTNEPWLVERDLVAFLGELAVKKYMNISSAMVLEQLLDELDHGKTADVILPNSITIDVKTAGKHEIYHFRKTKGEEYKQDVIAFTSMEKTDQGMTFKIQGYSRYNDLTQFFMSNPHSKTVALNLAKAKGVLKPINKLKGGNRENV